MHHWLYDIGYWILLGAALIFYVGYVLGMIVVAIFDDTDWLLRRRSKVYDYERRGGRD